jgi:hypothetical protein
MKRVFQATLWVGVFGLFVMVNTSQAQRGGSWRNQTALILCDTLMLNQEKSDKVVEIYGEVSGKRMEEWRNSGTDFQSMGDEERRKMFTEYRQNVTADMKDKLKDMLSEKEMAVVEPILNLRVYSPDPELRALRLIELKDEQRQKIQPLSMVLGPKMVPSGFGFGGQQMDEAERTKLENEFQKEKTSFLATVKDILSEEQNKAWKEKTDEVNKELEEMREQMRQRQ